MSLRAENMQQVEFWLDEHCVYSQGMPVDYHLLNSKVQETAGKKLRSRYFGTDLSQIPENRSKKELLWLEGEQRRAEQAGFSLELSPPWLEKLRCLYCSCLNTVSYPSPVLLHMMQRLSWRSIDPESRMEQLYILSLSPSLLRYASSPLGPLGPPTTGTVTSSGPQEEGSKENQSALQNSAKRSLLSYANAQFLGLSGISDEANWLDASISLEFAQLIDWDDVALDSD